MVACTAQHAASQPALLQPVAVVDGGLSAQNGSVPPLNVSERRVEAAGGRRLVCISSWTPMVTCAPDTDQDEYTGYQVELFRAVADMHKSGWSNVDWSFVSSGEVINLPL